MRARAASFSDHYSQARQFFLSQTKPEQDHVIAALTFELSKVETKAVRSRMLGQLANIDGRVAQRVADGLGSREPIRPAPTNKAARTNLPPSPALSILAKAKPTLEGRMIGCLIADGADAGVINALRSAAGRAGAQFKIVAPKVEGAPSSTGTLIAADYQLGGGPSVLFDAVAVVAGAAGAAALMKEAAAVAFVHDAFAHLKVIGYSSDCAGLLQQAGAKPTDAGVVAVDAGGAARLVDAAKAGRIWTREPQVRMVV